MQEDMDEQQPSGLEPAGNLAQQELVVFHVLEHFDAEDAIES